MIKTYIFDIDNTLCDTWPSLNLRRKNLFFRFINECLRISFLPSYKAMFDCVRRRQARENCNVFFLSARHKSLWIPTYIYLMRKIGLFNPNHLILVPNAHKKIKKIDNFIMMNKNKLIVVDDLSYNTEFGKTLYYKEVINYLFSKSDRIYYVDKNKIDKINNITV